MTGIEIAAVAGFISALKNLKDLTANLGDEVPREVYDQILDLSERFSNIQLGLIDAQQQAIELTARCRELEDALKRARDWEAEKTRYHLTTLFHGATVYALKPEFASEEAPHWLCAGCFTDGQKSHVQPQSMVQGRRPWKCSRCGATFVAARGSTPESTPEQ